MIEIDNNTYLKYHEHVHYAYARALLVVSGPGTIDYDRCPPVMLSVVGPFAKTVL